MDHVTAIDRGQRPRVAVIVGVVVLTLVIIGPFLRPGTLLLLDWVPGPRARLSPQVWGFPPGSTSNAPVEVLMHVIHRVAPWGFVRLLPLALVPSLAAWGLWRLFGPSALATLAATLFLVVNPFMYDRMLAGHIYIVVGVALLPLYVSYLVTQVALPAAIKSGMILAVMIALSLHFVFIGGLIALSVIVVNIATGQRLQALTAAASVVTAGALSLYWVIPEVFAPLTGLGLSTSHLEAFRTTADERVGLFPNVVGLYGFWRNEWPLTKQGSSAWLFVLGVILVVAVTGLTDLLRGSHRRMAMAVGVSGLAGVVLALGDQGPAGRLYVWLYQHIPGFVAMREPQKFLGLTAVVYAIGFGWGAKVLVEQVNSRRAQAAVAAVLLLLPVRYGFRELWGFAGFAQPSIYPTSWVEADKLLGDDGGKVWALPWHQYVGVRWAQNRIVANPFPTFFRREVISSSDPEQKEIQGLDESTEQRLLSFVVGLPDHGRHLGRLLAPLGIDHVLLAKVADHRTYAWLREQRDLSVVREWPDLVLFRNEAQIGTGGYATQRRLAVRDWGALIGAVEEKSLSDYAWSVQRPVAGAVRTPTLPKTAPGEPLDTRRLSPVSYAVRGSSERKELATPLQPPEGWEYNGARSVSNMGATASFSGKRVRPGTVHYVRWEVVRIGYVVGAFILAIACVLLIRERKTSGRGQAAL